MKALKVFFISILICFSLIPLSSTLAETRIENDEIALIISITDAYYTSLDDDHIKNDIAVHFTLAVENLADYPEKKACKFNLHFKLTIPSGKTYFYGYKVISSSKLCIQMIAIFYNHATEAGWYLIEITGILKTNDPLTGIGTESMYFDPPGSTPGTDPLTCKIYY